MAMFHSYVTNYQRVTPPKTDDPYFNLSPFLLADGQATRSNATQHVRERIVGAVSSTGHLKGGATFHMIFCTNDYVMHRCNHMMMKHMYIFLSFIIVIYIHIWSYMYICITCLSENDGFNLFWHSTLPKLNLLRVSVINLLTISILTFNNFRQTKIIIHSSSFVSFFSDANLAIRFTWTYTPSGLDRSSCIALWAIQHKH